MHVVQEASPNGYGMNINGSVLLEVVVAGPVFGLGLAMALAALIPSASPSGPPASPGGLQASPGGPPASASPANPADQPADV